MEHLRTVRLRPYWTRTIFTDRRILSEPTFSLYMWTTGKYDSRGQSRIAYRLTQRQRGKTTTIFEGEDFAGSPLHADDSDATVASLMSFLTLRPGDTDAEYFASYTRAQIEFVDQHAEALACYVLDRFERK